MTVMNRSAEYRYFGFTYFMGRLILVWLKASACKNGSFVGMTVNA